MHDGKLGELAGVFFIFYIDAVYPCCSRALAAPLYHLAHSILVAFKNCLDTAVGKVSHPPKDPMLLRDVLGVLPEIDALYFANDKDVSPDLQQSIGKISKI
jgi:hypothetical protein